MYQYNKIAGEVRWVFVGLDWVAVSFTAEQKHV